MNDSSYTALGTLEARAARESGAADRISLRDYIVSVEIGAFQVERDVTQRLKFNIVVDVPPIDPALNDDVDKILSYDNLTDAIKIELAVERLNLLETLADRIAARILTHPFAKRVYLRVEKLDRGEGDLGVEIMREQRGSSDRPTAATASQIVFLSRETISSDYLSAWMDAISKLDMPTVICVDDMDVGGSAAQSEKARSHIDVLAIDQTAWRVGALQKGCLVVGSRTELLWALGQGKQIVWAPYKMAFDAVPPPAA